MKKIALSALTALSMAACTTTPSIQYTVDATVNGDFEGLTASIVDYDNGDKLDSAVVVNGKAAFAGEIAQSRAVRLQVGNKRLAQFFLEPGNVTIAEDGTAAGTRLNEVYEAYIAQSDSLRKAFYALKDDTTKAALDQKALIETQYDALAENIYNENASNAIGYLLFINKAYEFDAAQLDSALAANPTMKEYKRVAKIVDAFTAQANTSVGKKFTDFEITYENTTYKLSDYVAKGNYTIVDFWASWCGPCIRETATLKDIYKKWNGKGLDILGVAVWDKPEDTLEAIKQHNLPWNCIINGQEIPTNLYGILGIPCILVIDPEGTIVARNVYGDDLKAKINELLSEKEDEAKKK